MTTADEYRRRMWRKPPRPLCPRAQSEPDPCDCGYVGEWLVRHWTELVPCGPTHGVTSREPGKSYVVRPCPDCRRGGPGHEQIAGWEEMCPRCGDVERFRWDGTLVDAIRNPKFTGPRNGALDEQLTLLDDE